MSNANENQMVVLTAWNYFDGSTHVLGVFSSKEKAKKFQSNNEDLFDVFEVSDFLEMDPEIN